MVDNYNMSIPSVKPHTVVVKNTSNYNDMNHSSGKPQTLDVDNITNQNNTNHSSSSSCRQYDEPQHEPRLSTMKQ